MSSLRPSPTLAAPLLAAFLLAGCASAPGKDPQTVGEADASYLNRECKLLGTVTSRSLFGGLSDEAKIQGAIKDVRAKAAAMGATHILMLKAEISGVANLGEATARAYRCPVKP